MRASTLVSFCTQLDLRIVIVVSENAALCLNQRLSDPKLSASGLVSRSGQRSRCVLLDGIFGREFGYDSRDAEKSTAIWAALPSSGPFGVQSVRLVTTEAKQDQCRPQDRAKYGEALCRSCARLRWSLRAKARGRRPPPTATTTDLSPLADPHGHCKDDYIRVMGALEGWPCKSIFQRTTCRRATA